MATINLGRIKPVFRGAYAGGTAYVVDDIVTHGNESFICIQAGTGNATSNASYWTKLAAKGSDGTDVGATLTTQGDILYRDSSGLQRLAKGTAGQVLKMNDAANAQEYGTISSDCEKLATTTISSNVSDVSIQGYFDDSIYSHYILITAGLSTTNDSNTSDVNFRMQTESGGSYSDYTSSNYYELRDSATGTSGGTSGGQAGRLHAANTGNFSHNNLEADIGRGMTSFMYLWMPNTSGFSFRARNFTFSFHDATNNYYSADVSHHIDDNGALFKGIRIYPVGGSLDAGRFTLYGFKK